jgi:hypothetical protein
VIAKRFHRDSIRYQLVCSGRAGTLNNKGRGFTLKDVYKELDCQLAWVSQGASRRVVKRGIEWWVIDDATKETARYWIAAMPSDDKERE